MSRTPGLAGPPCPLVRHCGPALASTLFAGGSAPTYVVIDFGARCTMYAKARAWHPEQTLEPRPHGGVRRAACATSLGQRRSGLYIAVAPARKSRYGLRPEHGTDVAASLYDVVLSSMTGAPTEAMTEDEQAPASLDEKRAAVAKLVRFIPHAARWSRDETGDAPNATAGDGV